jgi:hypothetical protein
LPDFLERPAVDVVVALEVRDAAGVVVVDVGRHHEVELVDPVFGAEFVEWCATKRIVSISSRSLPTCMCWLMEWP